MKKVVYRWLEDAGFDMTREHFIFENTTGELLYVQEEIPGSFFK